MGHVPFGHVRGQTPDRSRADVGGSGQDFQMMIGTVPPSALHAAPVT